MMPDWRSGSPNYITYAQSQNKTEAPHAYVSVDAVVGLQYEAGEFRRSIYEEPPRSRFDTSRPADSSSASIYEDSRDGYDDLDDDFDELFEDLLVDSPGEAAFEEASSSTMSSVITSKAHGKNHALCDGPATDANYNAYSLPDDEASTEAKGQNKKRQKETVHKGGPTIEQASETNPEDLLDENDEGSVKRVNIFERD